MHTICQHVAWAISNACKSLNPGAQVLVTGGGGLNTFLVQTIVAAAPKISWQVGDSTTLDFKEALAFAYLGFLHLQGLPGNVPSITRAQGPRILGTYCT
jgi:anhydro-N-acetylmuramic acid kinase